MICRQMLHISGAILMVTLMTACHDRSHEAVQWRCDDLVAGCDFGMLTVVADRVPQPMQPFTLNIRVKDSSASEVYASFAMEGMYMGLNRYRMRSDAIAQGAWLAEVTLPVCAAGRADWMMQINTKSMLGQQQFLVRFHSVSAP